MPVIGTVVACVFWFIDSAVDTFVFETNRLYLEDLLAPPCRLSDGWDGADLGVWEGGALRAGELAAHDCLSLIHISEPTRL